MTTAITSRPRNPCLSCSAPGAAFQNCGSKSAGIRVKGAGKGPAREPGRGAADLESIGQPPGHRHLHGPVAPRLALGRAGPGGKGQIGPPLAGCSRGGIRTATGVVLRHRGQITSSIGTLTATTSTSSGRPSFQ